MAKTEQASNLDKALEQIHKQFGKDAIFKMDGPIDPIDVISTGSILINKALVVGGIPRGRVIEIYGPESSGKCLTKDTYLLTEDGYQTIEEIFINNNFVPSCSNNIIPYKYILKNRYGDSEYTTNFTCNNKKPIFKITTQSGTTIKSTHNHPHLTISKIGNLVWKKTGDFCEDDYLVLSRKPAFGNVSINTTEAYLLGCFIADASFSFKEGIQFTNDDPDIKSLIENNFNVVFPLRTIKMYPNNDKGSVNYHFDKVGAKLFFEKYNIVPGIAKDKKVPKIIMQSDKDSLIAFLRGYMDCEAYFNDTIEVASASYALIIQIKLLLLQFGIIGIVNHFKVAKYPENDYWTLSLYGSESKKYIEVVGTSSTCRKEQIRTANLCDIRKSNGTNVNSIPNLGLILEDLYNSFETTSEINSLFFDYKGSNPGARLTFDRLKKILEVAPKNSYLTQYLQYLYDTNYYFDKVVSVEKTDPEPTFDFEMERTSSFIANGVVTHNTTLCLHIAAEAQKIGHVAFIDTEHALDAGYAKKIGVDVGDLLISQPNCGEEALDIVDTLVRSGEIVLIIVDSVAALTPKAEIEGEMGQSHMGLQARLMSQALRKMTGVISKSNCALIFTNQLRSKIGVVFGNPEVTTGGNALKYYASVRIDIRRGEKLKDKDNIIGNRTKIKISKNKVAAPFREAEVNIVYNVGIDKDQEILDLAVDQKIIEKAGAWYKYKEQKFQGEDCARRFAKDNRELLLKEIVV